MAHDMSDIDNSKKDEIKLFSVVMPAYNEEDVVEQTLLQLTAHLDECEFNYEIVVVNDGSTDKTETILEKFSANHASVRYVNNPGPGGYGYAIQKGLQHYKGDAVVVVTSDGSDSPKDVATYFNKIQEGYDCVFGSRFLPGTKVAGYPRFKLFMNRMANRFLAMVLRSRYNDFTNGFKCYRRHVIDDMQPIISGQFNITIEMSVSATLSKCLCAVVPNDWTQRDAGVSTFKISRLLKPYFITLIYCIARNYIRNIRR